MTRRRRSILTGTSFIPVTIFLVLVGWNRNALPPPREQNEATADVPAPRVLPGIEAFQEIAARPLFIPLRHPPPIRQIATATSTVLPPTATLVAILRAPDQRIALLRLANHKTVRVTEGQAVEGWTVIGIAPDRVRLRAGMSEQELAFPRRPGGASHRPGQP